MVNNEKSLKINFAAKAARIKIITQPIGSTLNNETQ